MLGCNIAKGGNIFKYLLLMALLAFPVNAQDNAEHVVKAAPQIGNIEQSQNLNKLPLLPSLPKLDVSDGETSNKLSTLPGVFVKEFKYEGNTAFTDKELAEIAAPFTNRQITFEELQEVRQKLTLHYVNNGYITSGVVIPDQPVKEGVIILKVIEGKLEKIQVEKTGHLHSWYTAGRIKRFADTPLNINKLQRGLQILRQDQLIRNVNAQLKPGIQLGESVLSVSVKEEKRLSVRIKFDNNHSPGMGEHGGELKVGFQNITGFGDTISGSFGMTEGFRNYDFRYSVPVTSYDTKLSFHYKESKSVIIESLFEDLDIISKVTSYGFTLSQPVYRSPSRLLVLGITGETKHSESELLGVKFSFSLGEEDGESDVTVLRFFQEWLDQSPKQVISARSTINWGIDALDSSDLDSDDDTNLPNSKFYSWLGQFQWIRRFSFGDTGFCDVLLRANAQFTIDPLLPIEKFSVGGMNSVRGYRINSLVRDNGYSSSIECRIPVLKNKKNEAVVQIAPFMDYGKSWNCDSETPDPKNITSIGLGFRWAIKKHHNFHLSLALPLRVIDNEQDRWQDHGVHFEFTSKLY